MKFKQFVVENISDIRFDRYLKKLYPNITQGIIEKNLRTGKIKLNNKKTLSNRRIKAGDIVLIDLILDTEYKNLSNQHKHFEPNIISLADKLINEYKLFASDDILIINKPHNLAVQGGSKINLSIDHALLYLNHQYNTDYKLVHRLDKATSGILLIAKNYEVAKKITACFSDKLIQKTYMAILASVPKKPYGIISNKIEKVASIGKEKMVLSPSGKLAETIYNVLNNNGNYSLVEFTPLTGRMHQLRIHSQLLACPIVGDNKYGGPKYQRMLLHAFRIFLPSEILGYEIKIEAPLPQIFNKFFLSCDR
ncbi:MAG: RluA family pseudouridine synthase [Rickettsiaceae bacterium]|nr:RluA family pseudouridine synthase [Rickettsiaceae bacterium]